ncbi:MAG: hypothetical protein QF449_00665 [Alphaproteobacteria bacterium]|nr:hypothetical protein [Alphaproteobacteria bacterium]
MFELPDRHEGGEFDYMEYQISSRAYLKRARERLGENEQTSLIYAALELRCGIEARMREYLEVQKHVSRKKKKGWHVAKLEKSLEQAFKSGEKIIRWAVYDTDPDILTICFYYIPVSKSLRKTAEKLGDNLHSKKKFIPRDDPYWAQLRKNLENTAAQLELANKGTLLGPPLLNPRSGNVDMKIEFTSKLDIDVILRKIMDNTINVRVEYLDAVPDKFKEEAHIWSFDD